MKRHLLFKSLLLLCALVVGTNAWAATAGYTPSAALSSTTGTVTGTASETWSYSITFDNAGYYGYQASYGWQLGAGPKSGKDRGCRAFSISTSDITGTITKIEVEAGSYNGNSKINVTVGGSAFGTQNQATYSGQGTSKSTFTGSASGGIVISATDAVRAFYLKSITVTYTPSGGGGSDPSISLESNSVNAAEGGENGTINVTYTNIASVDSEVKFYESNGTTEATYDWLTATINTTDNTKLDYTISANTGAARTAYMKVHQKNSEVYSGLITVTQAKKTVAYPAFNLSTGRSTDGTTPSDPTNASTEYTAPIVLSSATTKIKAIAYDAYGNKSSITDRTYTGVGPATLPFTFDGKKAAIESTDGLISYDLGSDYSSSPYLKFDNVDDYLILKFDGVPGTLTFDIKGNGSGSDPWAGTFTVQTSADGETYTDLKSYTSLGSKQSESFANELASDVRYIKWIYTAKTAGNVALGNIKLTSTVDVTIASSSGFATLYTGRALDFSTLSSELKAYTATVSENTVTLTEVANIPANTGVVLKGTQTTHAVPVSASSSTAQGALTGNTSAATAYNAFSGYDLYMLALNDAGKAQFTRVTSGSVAAGKAFLKLANSGSGARELNVVFADDEATGVADVRCKMADGRNDFYNLNGQKVLNPTKGLYIVNGKKVVIK